MKNKWLRTTVIITSLVLILELVGLVGCGFPGEPMLDDMYVKSLYRELPDGSGGYWHEYNIDAYSISPGASGAEQIDVSANTLGGWQFNLATDYLYFTTHIEDDWDGVSNPIIEVTFEVNVNNVGGLITDTVELEALCYHKSAGDVATVSHLHNGSTVVGQSPQYRMFIQQIIIDFVGAGIVANDVITFRVNLDTVASEVDDVIVNYFEFKYKTYTPAREG